MEANELNPAPAVLHATIQIKRAATGQTETYNLIGTPVADNKDPCNGSDAPDARS